MARLGVSFCLGVASLAGCAEKQPPRPNPPAPEPVVAQGDSDAAEPAWSDAVGGLQARIELRQDHVFAGTPILAVYLHLRNADPQGRPILFHWSPEQMKYRVVDAAGKDVEWGTRGMAEMGSWMYDRSAHELLIPPRGTLSFDLAISGGNILRDQVAAIVLGEGANCSWTLRKEDGPCTFYAVLGIPTPKDEAEAVDRPDVRQYWHRWIECPGVPIPTELPRLPPAQAERLIAEWGTAMLHDNGVAGVEAEHKLSLVNDPRVVAWYVKAVGSGNPQVVREALDQLPRFDSDEALAGIERGLAARPEQFDDPREEVRAQMADDVRGEAARALSRSRHPRAQRRLLGLWNDREADVRRAVLFDIRPLKTPESTELLKRMVNDADPHIRKMAHNELVERGVEQRTKEEEHEERGGDDGNGHEQDQGSKGKEAKQMHGEQAPEK